MGWPLPPFTTLAAEAEAWTSLAGIAELRAYCFATWRRLPPSTRVDATRAFLKLLDPQDRAGLLAEFGGRR